MIRSGNDSAADTGRSRRKDSFSPLGNITRGEIREKDRSARFEWISRMVVDSR